MTDIKAHFRTFQWLLSLMSFSSCMISPQKLVMLQLLAQVCFGSCSVSLPPALMSGRKWVSMSLVAKKFVLRVTSAWIVNGVVSATEERQFTIIGTSSVTLQFTAEALNVFAIFMLISYLWMQCQHYWRGRPLLRNSPWSRQQQWWCCSGRWCLAGENWPSVLQRPETSQLPVHDRCNKSTKSLILCTLSLYRNLHLYFIVFTIFFHPQNISANLILVICSPLISLVQMLPGEPPTCLWPWGKLLPGTACRALGQWPGRCPCCFQLRRQPWWPCLTTDRHPCKC